MSFFFRQESRIVRLGRLRWGAPSVSTLYPSHPIYRFGVFEVDPRSGELRKNGMRLKIQDQPFQILLKLLESAGQLVSREELRSILWPKDTFVDFDNGLNMAVKRLREVLGDLAERPTFIETVPRHGYRFIAPLERPQLESAPDQVRVPNERVDAPISEPVETTAAKPDFWRSRRSSWVMAFAAVMVLLSTFGAWRFVKKPLATVPSIEVVPLVALKGNQGSPAFSPDGNQIAFQEYEGEDGAIYTALVGGDRPLRLTAEPGVCCPTWSPDAQKIAFTRFSDGAFSINVVSALGGAEKILYTAKIGSFRSLCPCLDWSPDGKWLAFGQSSEQWSNSSIVLLSMDDLSVRPLTSPGEQEYDCEPAFSPDSQKVAFTRGSMGGLGKDLFTLSLTGGAPRRLTFDNGWGFGALAWTQDGSEIVYSSTRGGLLNLWRVPTAGGTPRPVAGVSSLAYHPSIPRKGHFLAYEHATKTNGIWRVRLRDKAQPLGPASRLIAGRGILNYRPSFSPDGKKIVFESDRLGYSDIWYCDSDGSNCTQLTSLHGTAGTARWSPDGHHVVFEFQSRHYYEIYVVDVPGGRPHLLTTFPESDNGAPNWSRDGKWIYFYSTHEKGPLQLWKIPFEGGTPVRVTKNGGVYATESADGRFLYFSKLEQPGIWKMSLIDGEEEQVLDQPESDRWFNWALSASGIYLISPIANEQGKLEYFDFRTRTKTTIGLVEKASFGLALAPDGKSLLYSRNEFDESEIMLVKNFQ
jgi:Tol biopolymer transport system component/DNA-binding winged helix-turn-helix (wHTH) protein